MNFNIITIFPVIFNTFKDIGFIKRAITNKILTINVINLRDFSTNKHNKVDDKSYGGGPGMVLQFEPIYNAIKSIKTESIILHPSPQGKTISQKKLLELSNLKNITLLCGRYEGVDQRVIDNLVDEEISVGDYVVSGGEIPSMLIIEGVSRLLPGAVDDENSIKLDSYQDYLLDYPHYTRPEIINNKKVPDVLLDGDHEQILRWRRKQALGATWLKKPELLKNVKLSKEDDKLLEEYKEEHK
tara:strand:+ start:568 stop:1293 length:726 start_codon:yes stop_codon:yes gene_type:complete